MKKSILLLFVFSIISIWNVLAKDFNGQQLRLRSDLKSFVQEEGFVPELDSDGDIKFKKEGAVYYISISDIDESPMYVTFFKMFSYPEDYSKAIVQIASTELCLYKGVKFLCSTSSVRIQAEMYVHDAEPFKYAFYKLMSQIASVQEDVISECKNAQTKFPQL